MAKKWPGGIITKNQATPTGPYQNGSAPGIWTLNQMSYWVKQALWPIAGNTNPNAFIENLFSTYLYTGNGGTAPGTTVINNIDLSTYSGIVWIKPREFSGDNKIFATGSGDKYLVTNATTASTTIPSPYGVTFNTNGFNARDNFGAYDINAAGADYASWTFREQPKFFDIVTFTTDGSTNTNQRISHNLGSTPGTIIVKATSVGSGWPVWHRSLTSATNSYLALNGTGGEGTYSNAWGSTGPTSSDFGINTAFFGTGITYVAYLFAHNAGGFGLSGTENVISCGRYTGTGAAGNNITLGYEPQWVMIKSLSGALGSYGSAWAIQDNMRGFPASGSAESLYADKADATDTNTINLTSTGFTVSSYNTLNEPYIYIAIRRGPMAVPTLGTSVFSPTIYSGNNTNKSITGVGFATDLIINKPRANTVGAGNTGVFWDRLRGFPDGSTNPALVASSTADEATWASLFNMFGYINNTNINPQDGYRVLNGSIDGRYVNYSSEATGYISWNLKRAPGFFDIVCYTGTGSATTQAHNLTVVPEMIIVKARSAGTANWQVYHSAYGPTLTTQLNLTNAQNTGTSVWNSTTPTASVFSIGTSSGVNSSSITYVAYLFATVAGVSKVGSYTGTGATLNINAGFTTGARFVMIKRTDSTGNWFIWDTARGMVAGTDPKVAANDAAAESNANWVYTATSGFQIVTNDPDVNASGGSYIYLAIA